MITDCSLCGRSDWETVYRVDQLPLFQNKIFETQEESQCAPTASVELVQCLSCGFVWNRLFDPTRMNYDRSYHNEQHYSPVFQAYVEQLVFMLKESGFQEKRIVEIGCGKGYFLDRLQKHGFTHLRGFDPAYEGNNPQILNTYFNAQERFEIGDLIILRHVLEHIADPIRFLQTIAATNQQNGMIFIEVPDFDWVIQRQAFWDIYYEHCNYFTTATLKQLCQTADIRHIFHGQYVLLWGALNQVKPIATPSRSDQIPSAPFYSKQEGYRRLLSTQKHAVVWGGASKGVTFLNVLDPECEYIRYVIDINPHKQGKFLAGTGHRIVSPEALRELAGQQVLIIVTNENYLQEIRQQIASFPITPEFVAL